METGVSGVALGLVQSLAVLALKKDSVYAMILLLLLMVALVMVQVMKNVPVMLNNAAL